MVWLELRDLLEVLGGTCPLAWNPLAVVVMEAVATWDFALAAFVGVALVFEE